MSTILPTRVLRSMAPISPWREFDGFENRIRHLFDEPFTDRRAFGWSPTVDVVETDNELALTAELPGVNPEDVDIEIGGNVLTLQGQKQDMWHEEAMKGERKMRIWERSYGTFARSFTLLATVNANEIKAEFDKGVLTIHMPKTEEAKGRRIAIAMKK